MRTALIIFALLFVAMLVLAMAGCEHPPDQQVKAAKICTDAGLIPDVLTDPLECRIPDARLK